MTEEEYKKMLISDLEDICDYFRAEHRVYPDNDEFVKYQTVLSNAWFTIEATLPHLLSVEEIECELGNVVYIESKDNYMGQETYCRIDSYRPRKDHIIINYFCTEDDDEFNLAAYNKTWRIWNTEPSWKQSEETPWDCD